MKLKALALLSVASMILCGCTAKNITPATSSEEPTSSVVEGSEVTSETSDVLSVSESDSVLRDELSSEGSTSGDLGEIAPALSAE